MFCAPTASGTTISLFFPSLACAHLSSANTADTLSVSSSLPAEVAQLTQGVPSPSLPPTWIHSLLKDIDIDTANDRSTIEDAKNQRLVEAMVAKVRVSYTSPNAVSLTIILLA